MYVKASETIHERGSSEAIACLERALAGLVDPPYRVVARRRAADVWAVGAVGIRVAELPSDLEGDELTLVVDEGGARSLEIDGRPTLAPADALEQLTGGRFAAYVLRASRLAGRFWEFRVEPL